MPDPGPDQVDYISGSTRLFGIVGDPIEQVRSPEMVTAEFVRRGLDAIMVPVHVAADDFERCLPALMAIRNLDGLVFTVPFKARACALAAELDEQARLVGAINALARRPAGGWVGGIFDGQGCVEAFRRRGLGFAGQRVMLIGAGGAGSAIAVAVAFEGPRALRLYDVDAGRAAALAAKVRDVDPAIAVTVGEPTVEAVDILMNASPVGMLGDPRRPIEADLPSPLVVFDAVVKPEQTPLLAAAEAAGCQIVRGREMMRGQISRIVDFFRAAAG